MKDAERIAELEAALRRSELLIEQLQAQLNLRRNKREREKRAGCSADKLAALSPAEQPAPVVPEVAGIGRDADHSRAVVLYLRKEPNNDDIRAIQEALRVARKTYMTLAALSPAEQPGQAVPVDLIERTICRLTHGHEHDKAVRELRAILEVKP